MAETSRQRQRGFLNRLRSSRIVLVSGVIVVLFLVVSLGRELLRQYEISRGVAALQQEITELEDRNFKLEELLSYLETDAFREREARLKLGLQKQGENVIIIPRDIDSSIASQESQVREEGEPPSNPVRIWWDYFFAPGDHS